jgi:hypothetical protein
VADELISRDEIIALLFRVNDIAETLLSVEQLLKGDDGEEESES